MLRITNLFLNIPVPPLMEIISVFYNTLVEHEKKTHNKTSKTKKNSFGKDKYPV